MRNFLRASAAKMSLPTVRGSDTYEDDVNQAREDNDPQTIFYLKLASADLTLQQALDASNRDILPTLYLWATKIERTVREKLGDGVPKRGTAQASWNRAAYRVELLDHLARNTPWMMGIRDNTATSSKQELTGEYHHDKLIYQKAVHGFVQDHIPNVLARELRLIERHITEIMVLGQGELSKARRFVLAFPSMNTGPFVPSGLRLVSIAFKKEIDSEGRALVTISPTSYEARLNKEGFDMNKLEPELLRAGEALVSDATDTVMISN